MNRLILNNLRLINISKILFVFVVVSLFFNKGLAINTDSKDSLQLVFTADSNFSPQERLNLAVVLFDAFAQSSPEKADEYMLTAIELTKQLKDTSKTISLYIKYADNKIVECSYDEANDAYQQAKYLILLRGSENEIADIYFKIATNYYDWSNYVESRLYYKKAVETYTAVRNKNGVAKCLRSLSAIASDFGDYELAIGYMQRAREIYSETGDSKSLVRTTLGLGVILESWGKIDKALSYFIQAYDHFKEEKNILQQSNLLLHIGDIYLKQKKYDQAIENYNNAIILESKVNNKKLRSIGLSNLGEVYFAINELDKALMYQKQALVIKYEVGDKKRIAISLLNIGEIYFAQGDNELAEDNIKQSLHLSNEANLKEIEIKSLLMLSKIAKKNYHFKDAHAYLEKYVKLKDEVFDKQSLEMLNDLSVKYEAKRIEKENELLVQKEAIISLELSSERETKQFVLIFLVFILIISITIITFIIIQSNQGKKNFALLSKKNKEITEQREQLKVLNKQFAKNKEQYRSIVENATTGIYKTLPGGEIVFANMSLIKMLGYNTFEELKNINLNKEKRNRDAFVKLLEKQKVISGREDVWKRTDGTSMYVNESAWIVTDDNGKTHHYEGIVEDVTKRKEAELALKESQRNLRIINAELENTNKESKKAKDEAVAANEIKSLFIANVSHEIRTPMNSIIGFSTLLSNTITNKQQLSHVNAIKSSSKNLLVIINDVLNMSKIQAGEIDIICEPISLASLVEGINEVFELRIEGKGLEFIKKIDSSVPTVLLDKSRMRQVLLNIVGNSVKFTDSGNITIKVSGSPKTDNTIDLSIIISDTGIGVPEEEHETIFEAFKQSKSKYKNNIGGTGLGLSISSRLVNLMGGSISLTSTVGEGSTFTIIIPNVKIATEEVSISRYDIADNSLNSLIIGDNETPLVEHEIPTLDDTLQNELISKFKSEWEILVNSHVINDTVVFANKLLIFSFEKKNKQLISYCETLLFSLNNFEIDNINILMKDMGQLFMSKI